MDPALNDLFRWTIEQQVPDSTKNRTPKIDPEAFKRLMGKAPDSDAVTMCKMMVIVRDEENKHTVYDRKLAFKDFEMLIQNLDNANNIAQLHIEVGGKKIPLWDEILAQLKSPHHKLRKYAAWICATAADNNIKTQERILVIGAIPLLAKMAFEDDNPKVRKKAVLAISRIVRNFQPGLDEALKHIPEEFKPSDKMDAEDMDTINVMMNRIRDTIPKDKSAKQ